MRDSSWYRTHCCSFDFIGTNHSPIVEYAISETVTGHLCLHCMSILTWRDRELGTDADENLYRHLKSGEK